MTQNHAKPSNWNPQDPPPKVCIWCYGPARYLVVWRYGINWTCWEGKCKDRTKQMVGFEYKSGQFSEGGLFTSESTAFSRYRIQEADRRAKENNKRAK